MALLYRYRALEDDDLLIFFSGCKGYHVGLPTFWEPAPSLLFHQVARCFAELLACRADIRIDASIYDKVRCFRAPNSRHPKTGLHKRRLSLEELLHLAPQSIRRLAAAPSSFELPAVSATEDQAVCDWAECVRLVEQKAAAKAQCHVATTDNLACLNRQTLDFICNGAAEGDRHRLLFSAAANLAEFGCPPALAHALLTEAALDSGLPPKEVHRQIECGLNHVQARLEDNKHA